MEAATALVRLLTDAGVSEPNSIAVAALLDFHSLPGASADDLAGALLRWRDSNIRASLDEQTNSLARQVADLRTTIFRMTADEPPAASPLHPAPWGRPLTAASAHFLRQRNAQRQQVMQQQADGLLDGPPQPPK